MPAVEIAPGANIDASRKLLETDPAKIVYVNFQTGNDTTGDGSIGNPFKTYAKGVAEVGATSKTHVEWMTIDKIAGNITVPTQASIGIAPALSSLSDWTPATTPPGGVTTLFSGIAVNSASRWVAVSSTNNTQPEYSDDSGDTWTPATGIAAGSSLQDVDTDGSGVFVAVGSSGGAAAIWRSTDGGQTWGTVANPFTVTNVLGVSSDRSGNFVAVGSGGEVAFSTNNGVTWTLSANSVAVFGGTSINNVSNDRSGNWVAVGSAGKIARSADNGNNWTIATTPAFSASDNIKGITTDRSGRWVAVGSGSVYAAYSTDNGDTWTASTISVPSQGLLNSVTTDTTGVYFAVGDELISAEFESIGFRSLDGGASWTQIVMQPTAVDVTETGLFGIATDEAGHWVTVGRDQNVLIDNYSDIQADLCGFDATGVPVLSAVELRHVTRQPAAGKALESSLALVVDRCDMRSADDDGIDLTNALATVTNTLAIAQTDTKRAIKITGAAATDYDIDVEFCTIIGDIEFANAGSTGKERFQNCIVQGSAIAAVQMTMESGTIFSGTITGIVLSAKTATEDPIFIDTTYRIQRESGYLGDGSDIADFDSPLLGIAIDHVGATEDHVTSTGQIRDPGAWSHDDSAVSREFIKSYTFPDPVSPGDLGEVSTPKALFYQGDTGESDVANDPARRSRGRSIKWDNLKRGHINVIEFIEDLDDTHVFLSIFPDDQPINMPEVVVDGNQLAGVFAVQIDSAHTFSASRYTIAGKEYDALYVWPTVQAATHIVLDRPLEDNITDNDIIQVVNPRGIGEFKLLPQKRNLTSVTKDEQEFFAGVEIQLVQ